MPWAIFDPVDGQEPGGRALADGEEPREGEMVVEQAPDGLVWDAATSSLRARTASETLSHAKASKEAELRDAADGWYQGSVRSFEGAIVTAKYGRSGLTALNTEERAVFDEMNANYTRLKSLIAQARSATTIGGVEAVQWTP